MIASYRIIVALWLAFIAYWFLTAGRTKKTARRARWWQGRALRLGIVILVLILAQAPGVSGPAWSFWERLGLTGPVPAALGAALCALGIGIAIWARVYIGANWGMPMSLREGHELVTSGPYAYVRHPIYSGILLAMLGTAITDGPPWLVILLLFGAYFIYGARIEERDMAAQFPTTYPAYVRRTKMLAPFLF